MALSYFDHPPLHQWIAHGFVALFGESHAARLPFWALWVAANAPLYGLTRRLFGVDAALWALFAFNASAYFLVLPDGYLVPDAPLLPLAAAAVWAIVEATFPPGRSRRAEVWLWLAAGLALGLAGLAKYSAIFVPLGLAAFFLSEPDHRRWFARWEPFAAAALALLVFSPALIWNAENDWVSFAFQSARAASSPGVGLSTATTILETALEQVGLVSPWIFVPTVIGLARAARPGAEPGERLLLWFAAPTLTVFLLLPLTGQRPIPHWFNCGWLFAFPLAGRWLSRLEPRPLALWARASAALAVLTVALYLPLMALGPARLLPFLGPRSRDPTAGGYDWPDLKATRSWRGDGTGPPAFAVVDHWRVGGKVGVALGPGIPVCAFTDDPRGFAFACDPKAYLGRDALIVLEENEEGGELPKLAAFFDRLGPIEWVQIGRLGVAERRLAVVTAHDLTRPYPMPYGPARQALTLAR